MNLGSVYVKRFNKAALHSCRDEGDDCDVNGRSLSELCERCSFRVTSLCALTKEQSLPPPLHGSNAQLELSCMSLHNFVDFSCSVFVYLNFRRTCPSTATDYKGISQFNASFNSLVSTSTAASKSSTPLSHLRHLAELFSQIFAAHSLDRSVFVTQEGALGTAPALVKEGDGLWLVARAPCCLVLKEVAENVVLGVGEERGNGEDIDKRRGELISEQAEQETQG
jgi:hypothetical protein